MSVLLMGAAVAALSAMRMRRVNARLRRDLPSAPVIARVGSTDTNGEPANCA